MRKGTGWIEQDCLGLCRDVHEDCAELEEISWAQGLGEKVGVVVGGADVGHGEFTVLDELADPQVASVDVLRAIVMPGIVCEITCGFVVGIVPWGRRGGSQAR